MKVKVTLPRGYGRAYSGADRFEKSAPTFDVEAFDDMGNAIQDAYPSRVTMGPEMYNFLTRIMPRLAARRGEDLNYEGIVESNRKLPNAPKYAYYGFGNNPLGLENTGIGLIGFGDTITPGAGSFQFVRDGAGNKEWKYVPTHNGFGVDPVTKIPNFVYSRLLDAPSPNGLSTKSEVLTNILNDSWDFSPLLAPLFPYTDLEYNKDNDPDKKGPRPTDHWVPKLKAEAEAHRGKYNVSTKNGPVTKTGNITNLDDRKMQWIPIPLVQDMPIYNLKHPMWEENPEAAWNLVHDPASALNWKEWGTAPSYADYTGLTSATEGGEVRPRDYLLYNSRMAQKPGYFEDFPNIKTTFEKNKEGVYEQQGKDFSDFKKNAHENFRDVKGQRSVEKLQREHEEASKEFEEAHLKDMQQKTFDAAKNFNKNHLRPDDAMVNRASNKDMKAFYRALVGKAFFDQNKPLLEARGITPEEKNAIYHYAKDQGWEKYNKMPDDETKMIYILDDYAKNKKDREQQDNILAGVKEPF